MKTWKETMLDYIDAFYMEKAEEWKKESDDRKLYSNIVIMTREGIESLDDNPHVSVCIAMDDYLRRTYKRLDEIYERCTM